MATDTPHRALTPTRGRVPSSPGPGDGHADGCVSVAAPPDRRPIGG